MFKLPSLARKKCAKSPVVHALHSFTYDEIEKGELIGSGAYGKVYKSRYENKDVVVKELDSIDTDDLIKEARFHSKLSHDNIVKFHAVCLNPMALMLEHVYFDMTLFGRASGISSLDNLLSELHAVHCEGFEHIVPVVAKGILTGLQYLHEKGVAHRDLKPGNVLVSNQHFNERMTAAERELMWREFPCITKLTDFGESWGTICQTSAAKRSHTVNIYKGTPAFMAPEVIDPIMRPMAMNENDLKLADIWSLSMVYFCITNPGLKVPYYKEIKEAKHLQSWQSFLVKKVASASNPEGDSSYDPLKATKWLQVHKAFKRGMCKIPKDRPNLHEVEELLNEMVESDTYTMAVNQNSAFDDAHPFGVEGNHSDPLNDGRNACSFFACKISEHVLQTEIKDWADLAKATEMIITEFPISLNPLREKEKQYDAVTAYDIMVKNGLICGLNLVSRSSGFLVFSDSGRKELAEFVEKSLQTVAIMTVPPYTFVIGRCREQFFIVDTHRIGQSCGGNGGGIVKVFPTTQSVTWWVWERLYGSGIRAEYQQIIDVNFCCQSPVQDFEKDLSASLDSIIVQSISPLQPLETSEGSKSDSVVDDIGNEFTISNDSNTAKPVPSGSQLTSQTRDRENELATRINHPDERGGGQGSQESNRCMSTNTVCSKKAGPQLYDDLAYPERWEDVQQHEWGPYQLPYISVVKRKLKFAEQLALIKACKSKAVRIPQGCRETAIFIIDSTKISDPCDLQSDLNGVFRKCLEIKAHIVEATAGNHGRQCVKVINSKQKECSEEQWYLKVNRKQNQFGLTRDISYFINKQGHILNNSILMQYVIDQKTCGNVSSLQYKVLPHGNSKGDQIQPFHPLKKSTLKRLHEEVAHSTDGVSSLFETESGRSSGDYGDQPRSKKQISDFARMASERNRMNPNNEVEAILAYNEELDDKIIWSHSDIPDDLWVLGTNRMQHDLGHAEGGLPISVDPTFNFGKYEVTPVTYRHQFILSASKNIHGKFTNAVMLGPTIIHHSKCEDTFDRAISEISRKGKLCQQKIGIVTDGEEALINACKSNMPDSISLRCTIHFRANCKSFLKSIGIKGDTSQAPFLDIVFGEQGLIECEDKKDLKERLKKQSKLLNELEAEFTKTEPKFSTYLKEREKKVLRKLIRDTRKKGGLTADKNGIPQRVFTNQSETVNSMLAAKKEALGYSKKDDLSKASFIHKVWEKVVKEQSLEIEKALYGQSRRFKLSDSAMYLHVDLETWYNWCEAKRKR